RRRSALVIGADQILDCDGTWFEKPVDRDTARAQLLALSDRMHELITAVCVAKDSAVIWRYTDRARMRVRYLTPEFVVAYLDAAGERVLNTVGAYEIEGLGIQLFDQIEGDSFTIQGLPLLRLLGFLRGQRAIPM
ncbi:MAG: septum formation protein Maf, partial [Alphaproteobacteria bacterium]|nr:septum formation protein Maf [Alphaproteobacteria bacterium]